MIMKNLILISVLFISLISCGKENIRNTWSTQEKNIEDFVDSKMKENPEYEKIINKGSVRLIVRKGEGDSLAANGNVSFFYAAYVLNGANISDGNIFATNNETEASRIGWNLSDKEQFKIRTVNLGEDNLVEGLKNGLVEVRGGEESYILFSGQYGFGKNALGTIPANSALVYHIWVESISNK